MVIRMIHRQHYNIYIASCDEAGGIYHYQMREDGQMKKIGYVHMDRPMYMIIHNKKMYILLRSPFKTNKESGLVVYDIDDNGRLTNPSEIVSTKGEVACHLAVDGEKVYCVNYISGNIISLPDAVLKVHKGKGTDPKRQETPHTHYVGITPDNGYICVADLGLDSIFFYDKNLNFVSRAKVPEGHGARHLVFSDDGKTCFCVNELASTVSAFEYHNGTMEHIVTTRALPEDFAGESTASAIRFENGKVYVSNRGHNSISTLEYKRDGQLTLLKSDACGGDGPRDFDFVGGYIVVTNEKSDSVAILKKQSMELIGVEKDVISPVCVAWY